MTKRRVDAQNLATSRAVPEPDVDVCTLTIEARDAHVGLQIGSRATFKRVSAGPGAGTIVAVWTPGGWLRIGTVAQKAHRINGEGQFTFETGGGGLAAMKDSSIRALFVLDDSSAAARRK